MDNRCPICEEEAIRTCRCFRSDSECKNGHKWHNCVVHHVKVPAHSDHSLPIEECTCIINKDIRNIYEKDYPILFRGFDEGFITAGQVLKQIQDQKR
jgi:hypothetical protein